LGLYGIVDKNDGDLVQNMLLTQQQKQSKAKQRKATQSNAKQRKATQSNDSD